MGECQSRTESSSCGIALMPVEPFVFAQDFCNFCIFLNVSVLIADPNFEFTTSIVKGNSIVPSTTLFPVLIAQLKGPPGSRSLFLSCSKQLHHIVASVKLIWMCSYIRIYVFMYPSCSSCAMLI